MENIKITLETLYDILRNEKKKEDLQKLEGTFYIDVVEYLKEKISFLEKRAQDKDIFASGERDKLEYELRSIHRILKEIYEKREKKIIDIALNRSRTGSDIIDTSSMLNEEKEFYLRILRELDNFRRGILVNLFKGELPNISGAFSPNIKISSYLEETPLKEPEIKKEPPIKTEEPKVEILTLEVKKTKIKFTHPLPSFVWKDMKVYGPFDVGDEIEIFPEVADLIVRKGRAEKV
ncbi:MAG: hypothetical protein V2A62_01950 [Candidatus Woesearchaeota archaeon]